MATYSLCYKPSVEKDLQSIPRPIVGRIIERVRIACRLIHFLLNQPSCKEPSGCIAYRVGDYRIVYEVNTDAMHIIVQYVRHRREVHRRLL